MADYYCDDCQTNQCKLCESLLHTTQLTDIVQIDDCFNHWHHRRPLLSLSNHSLTNELSSLSSSSGVLLPENSNSEEEEDKSNCSKQIDLNNITLARKKTSSSTTKSVTNKVSTTDLIQQPPPPPIIINKNQNNLHNIQSTNHEKILSTSPLSDPIVEDDFDENDNDNDDIVEQRVDNIELSSAETSNTASTTLSTTTTTNNSKSKKKKKRQQQQLQQQHQQQQNSDKKTIIDDGDDDDIGDGSITSTLLNKKKIITSTIVNNNTNDANKKHTSSSSSSTSLSSDPSSSDDSSEGYVSSTTITKNRHRKSTIATNQTSLTTAPSTTTTTTASMTMTNGGRDLKSTTTTTSTKQPSSSSLLMPLDTDDPLLDFDIDNNNGGSNGKNGWSDVNLSTTPPKSTFDSSPNIMDNNHNHQHQQIFLPDVAQLSLGNSSSSSPPPSSSSLSSNQAATLKLNGYKKNRTNSESSSASSSSTISDQNLAEFSDPNQNDDQYDESTYKPDCFLLIDAEEVLQVKTVEEFIAKLGCQSNTLVKVVSIFGNTGEGKSHTLNYTFYDCKEVFRTSPTQNSCTIGIWCSFDRRRRVLTIDTEGLLGLSDNNNRRTRLLLKVLAISDVIIYRTRAERLHNDLFTFLGSASQAYIKHFAKELRAASQRCNLQCTLSDLGPVVIIFHETVHTDVLHQGKFFFLIINSILMMMRIMIIDFE